MQERYSLNASSVLGFVVKLGNIFPHRLGMNFSTRHFSDRPPHPFRIYTTSIFQFQPMQLKSD